MSRFTSIRSDIWIDEEVGELDPNGKLIYVYLLTSPLGNAAGYFKIPTRQIAFDLGLEEKIILPQLTKQKKLWKYHEKSKQILFPNYFKYNKIGGTNQLIGINNQIMPLEKCPLHVDFLWAVHKYLGDKAFSIIDTEILKYVQIQCKEREGKDPQATVLLEVLNNYTSLL